MGRRVWGISTGFGAGFVGPGQVVVDFEAVREVSVYIFDG